jgi:AGCS family alanine or glycine:cation symporter
LNEAQFARWLTETTEALASWVWTEPLFLLLLGCGLAFSVVTKFIQYRILTHGWACIRGKYDRPEDKGQINHFQALSAALSATIGLGNIGGVAVAVSLGGPGAIFWMWIVGLFGMALKFMECTLAVMFRDVREGPDPGAPADAVPADKEADAGDPRRDTGEVRGGPMWYIQRGLVDPLRRRRSPFWVLFQVLAILFAISAIFNSFSSGNMFQGWNVADMLWTNFGVNRLVSAAVMATLVSLVIIGGIRRIGQVAASLVPFMCVVYVLGALYVIILHADEVPQFLALIVRSAFTPVAEAGAFAGVSVYVAFTWGLRRALFSNEAGQGSAAIAHAAARTDEPIREGVVAGLGPFIDTLVICTMTALVLLMTGTWNRPAVGAVAALEEDRVIVAVAEDLPENLQPLYLDRVQVGRQIDVHLARGIDVENTEVAIPIAAVEPSAADWAAIERIVLDAGEITATDRARLEVGQRVHLDLNAAEMAGFAFDTSARGFGKYMVTLAVCLFAFSTMISWSYYGEKGAEFLLGPRAILPYKFIFIIFVVFGMLLPKFDAIYNVADSLAGLMVLCNLPAVILLSPHVIRAGGNYFRRLDRGEMKRQR